MNTSYKIAALGKGDSMFPFLQIGIDVFQAAEGNDLPRQVARMIKSGYSLFFISEDSLSEAPSLLTLYDMHPNVTLIPLPGFAQTDMESERIQDMVARALGRNIL